MELEDLKDGMMICASGGCGKTYITKKLLKNKAIFLAPTNVASLKLGGQTLHSFFKIDRETGEAGMFPKP